MWEKTEKQSLRISMFNENHSYLIPSIFPGFHKVMEGIEKAIEMGYNPIKVLFLHVFINLSYVYRG